MTSELLPSIALVTPSFNRAKFLRACIESVLRQQYPRLQYVVMDGGSTDGSAEIIKEFQDRLHYWQSERDNGPYSAVAEGFKKTDCEVLGWINADDMHLPWTLATVGSIFRDCPKLDWVTTETQFEIAGDGLPSRTTPAMPFAAAGFRRGENGPTLYPGVRFIQQESTFWRRSLWERAGARFDPACKVAGDFELWDRFFDHAILHSVDHPLGAFRRHGEAQLSVSSRDQYVKECRMVLARRGAPPFNPQILVAKMARIAGVISQDLEKIRDPFHLVRRDLNTDKYYTYSF
jgi:hypothetical protein